MQSHPGLRDDDHVFCMIGDPGEPMSYASVRKLLKTAAAKAGIKKRIHPHLFRHTMALFLATQIT
nr:tyrosine-type recombinase/integrase [Thermoplasma sp. Kam2015]